MGDRWRLIVWPTVAAAIVATGICLALAPKDMAKAPPPAKPGTFLFLAGGSDEYWSLCVSGANSVAKELGARIDVRLPSGEGKDGLRQHMEWLRHAKGDEYDGVAVAPIDPEPETELINALSETTTVVTVDSDAPKSRRMFYVGSSNYEAGTMAADIVKRTLSGGGKIALLVASLAKTNAAERNEGFADGLRITTTDGKDELDDSTDAQATKPVYTVVNTYFDDGDYDRCRENVRNALRDHPDLDIIVCTFGYHGPLALETLAEIEGAEKVKVVAFDEDERVLAGIESGTVAASIVQDPFMFGAEAVRMLEFVRSGKLFSVPSAGRVDIGVHCIIVDRANLAEFKARLADRLASPRKPSGP